jgi:hypothetical protein
VIRPGETAARLAERYTGDARNRRQPWFQIVNPLDSTFVPKSRYASIQAGWHACVAGERLVPPWRQRGYAPASWPPVDAQATVPSRTAAADVRLLWWSVPLFAAAAGVVFAWAVYGKYVDERRARRVIMQAYGDRFVAEFERPLFRRRADRAAIRAQLRFRPARHRLDILIAPADGRTYPNLVDHRRNLEYDIERVQRLLGDEPFVSGLPYAEGSWVVIPFRLEPDRQQEGVL